MSDVSPPASGVEVAPPAPSSELRWLQALQRVSALVADRHPPEAVLHEALTSAMLLLDGGTAVLFRWDAVAGLLRRVYVVGPRADDTEPEIRPGHGLVGAAFSRRATIIENDYQGSPIGLPRSRAAGVRAVIVVPIAHRGQQFGTIGVGRYAEGAQITEVDAERLKLLASQVAAMLESAEHTAQLERRLERIHTLNRLTRLVTTSLDLDHVLQQIARAAVELTHAVFASFWLADEAARVLRWGAYSDHAMVAGVSLQEMRYGEGTAGRVAASRASMNIDDVFAEGGSSILDWWARHNLRSCLAVPVLHGDRLLAVLALNGRAAFRLDALDRDILDGFLAQAGTAIHNASLYADVRRHREQLQAIIDHSPAAISLRDGRGQYLLTNRRWEQLGALVASDGAEAAGPVGSAPLSPQERAALANGQPVESEVVLAADGRPLTFLASTFPLVDAAGALYAVGTIMTNITDRKRLEEEIAASLAAQQAANARLEELNRAQHDFVAVVSHEFRTPLTGIQGLSELMRDGDIEPHEVQQFAADIYNEAERLTRMISELLDLERMEAGRMPLYRAAVDLGQVVVDVVERTRPTAPGHVLRRELSATLPAVSGDRDKLTQVLVNLLSNAIKYAPEGGEVVVGTGWWREGDAPHAHLWVRDQGLGIPAEALGTIFERYARVEQMARRGIAGTGLGLPIVRQIVELHGGRVWAESDVGRGSTFHVILPLGDGVA